MPDLIAYPVIAFSFYFILPLFKHKYVEYLRRNYQALQILHPPHICLANLFNSFIYIQGPVLRKVDINSI